MRGNTTENRVAAINERHSIGFGKAMTCDGWNLSHLAVSHDSEVAVAPDKGTKPKGVNRSVPVYFPTTSKMIPSE